MPLKQVSVRKRVWNFNVFLLLEAANFADSSFCNSSSHCCMMLLMCKNVLCFDNSPRVVRGACSAFGRCGRRLVLFNGAAAVRAVGMLIDFVIMIVRTTT